RIYHAPRRPGDVDHPEAIGQGVIANPTSSRRVAASSADACFQCSARCRFAAHARAGLRHQSSK
ncbi:MAG: hypothetical protein QM690_11060, partial [Sphingobium sp.]